MAKKKKATLSSKLKALNKAWKKATPKQGGVGVPDGTYEVRIESAILEEAKSTGRLQIHWILTVLTAAYANKALHKYDGCDRPEDLDWVQGTLDTLELEIPDNLADIGPTLEEAQGLLAEVTVQTRDEFTNIYFNDLLADQEEEEEEDETEDETEDEVEDEVEDEDEDEAEEDEDEDETEEEEEEEEEESDEYDEDDVKAMNLKELKELIQEEELKVKTKDVKIGALRKAVIKKLF